MGQREPEESRGDTKNRSSTETEGLGEDSRNRGPRVGLTRVPPVADFDLEPWVVHFYSGASHAEPLA